MKKIFLAFILLGILGSVAYFSYPVIQNRYLSKNDSREQEIQQKPSDSSTALPSANSSSSAENSEDSSPAETIIENSIQETTKHFPESSSGNIKANITPTHCADDCRAFALDLVLFAYCEEVCGISPIKTDASNCEAKKDLEKDYCLKDLAITKSDATLCKSIADDNIRKTCQNRIREDMLEKIHSSSGEGL
jgi:hypothetical protein